MPLEENAFTFQIPNFLAGVHTCPDYRNRPINSLTKAKNAVISDCGYLTRRVGLDMFGGQDPNSQTTLYVHDLLSIDEDKLYALRYHNTPATGLRIAYCDGKAGTWTQPTHAAVAASTIVLGNASKAEVVLKSDGTRHVYWAGNTTLCEMALATDVVTELTDDNTKPPPDSTDVITFKGRTFYLRNGSEVHFSKLLEPETHERVLDLIKVRTNDKLTVSIVPWKDDAIIIFLNNAIYQLYVGASPYLIDWSFDLITDSIGLFSNTAITQAYDDIIFLDNYGKIRSLKRTLTSLSSGVEPVPVSYPVKDLIKVGLPLSALNNTVHLEFYDGRVYFTTWKYSGGSREGSVVYVYDIFRQAWTGPYTFYASATTDDAGALDTSIIKSISHIPTGLTNITLDMEQLYVAGYVTDATDGDGSRYFRENYTIDSSDDYGRAYVYTDDLETQTRTVRFEIITRPHDFGHPHQKKTLKWVDVEYGDESEVFSGNGSFTFYAKDIEDAGWTEIGTESYTTSETFKKVRFQGLEVLERAEVFQFRIVDDSATDGPKIRGMWIHGFGDTVQDDG